MEVLVKIAQFLLSLSLLVVVHEMGHFTFARLFRVRVDKFRIFFDYKFSLWKKKIGATDFGFGWIPLGGYVKIAGMVDESMDLDQMKKPAQPWEFRSKPAWQRLLIMVAGVLYNLLFAWLIYTMSLSIWGEQYLPVDQISDGLVATEIGRDIGFQTGDRVLSVYGEPVQRFRDINASILVDGPGEVRVLRDGHELSVFVRDDEIGRVINGEGVVFSVPRVPFVIGGLVPEGGAMQAQLLEGDHILAVNDQELPFFDQYKEALHGLSNEVVEVLFERDGVQLTSQVRLDSLGRLGVFAVSPFSLLQLEQRTYTFVESIPRGLRKAQQTTVDYIKQLRLIFSPEVKAVDSLGGFITIGNIFPSTWDWQSFWSLTAFLSILLGVMNILPIPALDGGHVVLLLYEMISGKKPSLRFLEIVQMIGILFILALVILANANDLIRLFAK